MQVRRIVTGHDAAGAAVVLSDDLLHGRSVLGGLAEFAVVWKTVSSPVDNDDATDRSQEPVGLTQPNGSVLRIVEAPGGSRSPMHRTDSLDYGVVLEGEVDLELDNGQVTHLKAGDVIVQRGTVHAWINPSDRPNKMLFILLDATPVTVNGAPLPTAHSDIRPD